MADRWIVAIPEPFPDSSIAVLDERFEIRQGRPGPRFDEAELIEFIRDADAVAVYSRDHFTRTVLGAAPKLRVIAKGGSRPSSNVDIDAAEERGVRVIWTPGANAVSVAEMAIMLILVMLRRFCTLTRRLEEGGWRDFDLLGNELAGRTLGLVGFGAVGRQVAKRYAAFGGSTVAFDPRMEVDVAERLDVRPCGFDELLSISDIVSLHCEMNAATAGLMGRAAFAAMKPDALLVNTARGGLVDEQALLEALDLGLLRGAALDVFAVEPPQPDHPLLSHPRILATPHVAAFTHESIYRESAWALEDAGRLLAGREPIHS
jgi:D-3-phosphoglycerate dehydrogenase / 2-oxoglutarate reductase